MRTVLVVDDRSEARELIAEQLGSAGFRVVAAQDGVEGWRRFRSAAPDLVITDLRMPRADGIALLRRVRTASATPVILLTAHGDVASAVAAMKSGATEFLRFPDDLEHAVGRARELLRTAGEVVPGAPLPAAFVGRSRAIRRARERMQALAPLRVPVLLAGERGSGRDSAVAALHGLATPEPRPLVTLRPGERACADPWSSTLNEAVYLDEVQRHPREAQDRWARRLREARLGRSTGSLRVYASSCEDLGTLARGGRFHPELAALLGRFAVTLPPLRERKQDLADLVPRLARELAGGVGRPTVRLLPSGLARLRAHAWPGNLRELVSVLERSVAFARDGALTGRLVQEVLGESSESLRSFRRERLRREREQLVALLRECGGNLAEVARRLELTRSAVHYRARKHGLLRPGGRR